MHTGTIVFFDPYKGFGKIKSATGEEIFVHIKGLVEQVYKGNLVTYDLATINENVQAINVKLKM